MATLQPLPESQRILAVDVLRGVALLGILMVNVVLFAEPFAAVLYPPSREVTGDWWAWALVRTGFELKFITLFSLLFGAGMVIQMQRAEARGTRFGGLYVRRLLVLFGFGVLHVVLLWYGDILAIYALAGLLLLLLAGLTARTMLLVATLLLALSVLIQGCLYLALVAIDGAPPTPATVVEPPPPTDATHRGSWQRFMEVARESDFEEGPEGWVAAETVALREGPFVAAALMRLLNYGCIALMTVLLGFGLRIVGVFLLGAALMKAGFFAPSYRPQHRLLALTCLPVGLLLEALGPAAHLAEGDGADWLPAAADALHLIASLILCAGYTGAIAWLTTGDRPPALITRALAAVGRLALTNYILQSLIAACLFQHWGLALFGTVDRPAQLAMALAIFILQLIISPLWLRHFRLGPLEWVWRRLTYGQAVALRR